MSDWIGATWIWLVLGVGLVWFLVRSGGMGCGMGGHGGQGGRESAGKAEPPGGTDSSADYEKQRQEPAGAAHGAHRHGGCC
ncbi:MAG TPA: hypothetical protein VLM91_08500 [Candidatus Methylomirabilis sp.]|nr:hypothetical protein [Candidatus Methylomirabilis sp.]